MLNTFCTLSARLKKKKKLFHWADKVQFAPQLLPKMHDLQKIPKKFVIQSNQVKHTPTMPFMNDFKVESLRFAPKYSIKFKFAFLYA